MHTRYVLTVVLYFLGLFTRLPEDSYKWPLAPFRDHELAGDARPKLPLPDMYAQNVPSVHSVCVTLRLEYWYIERTT